MRTEEEAQADITSAMAALDASLWGPKEETTVVGTAATDSSPQVTVTVSSVGEETEITLSAPAAAEVTMPAAQLVREVAWIEAAPGPSGAIEAPLVEMSQALVQLGDGSYL